MEKRLGSVSTVEQPIMNFNISLRLVLNFGLFLGCAYLCIVDLFHSSVLSPKFMLMAHLGSEFQACQSLAEMGLKRTDHDKHQSL